MPPIARWTLIDTGMLMAVTPSQEGHHAGLGWQPRVTTALLAAELLRHPKVPTKLLQGKPGNTNRDEKKGRAHGLSISRPPGDLTRRRKINTQRAPRGSLSK